LGAVGLVLAAVGFASYAEDLLGFGSGWLALGTAGAAMLAVAFYLMIRADTQAGKWKKQLENALPAAAPAAVKTAEAEAAADNGDVFFDENYEKWKNPFEEGKE
jgi:hypothetical protein